jgi:pSer/pThr/pTyr-binding forkhead associated (FHA) protein
MRLDDEPITIGARPSCDMALASPDVSRRHCRLQIGRG